MTVDKFNNKWKKYLESGYCGLSINNKNVIDYLNSEFETEVKTNTNFSYAQIKLKYGEARVLAETDKCNKWENKINDILNNKL